MAGGGGTRLWPLSRRTRPKQMLSLFDERTLFQTSVQRLAGLFPSERIFVVTVAEQAEELRNQAPEIPWENFFLEPTPRGTASVVGLAAIGLLQRNPQAVMAVLTADHYIKHEDRFRHLLRAAHALALDGYLVTLGIHPTFPATGFGYIRSGLVIGEYLGHSAYHALAFTEKPDEELARQMLAGGDFAWNSGMFVWKASQIMEEFSRQMPDLYDGLLKIQSAWASSEKQSVVDQVWAGLQAQTIDYGIMENARCVAVIPAAGLGWSDVGSWDSLFDVVEGDPQGNIVMGGHHVGVDTRSSLVYVNQEHRLIVTIGVEDLVVVDTGDVLLVCRKDQAQKVRQVVNWLKKEGKEYL